MPCHQKKRQLYLVGIPDKGWSYLVSSTSLLFNSLGNACPFLPLKIRFNLTLGLYEQHIVLFTNGDEIRLQPLVSVGQRAVTVTLAAEFLVARLDDCPFVPCLSGGVLFSAVFEKVGRAVGVGWVARLWAIGEKRKG